MGDPGVSAEKLRLRLPLLLGAVVALCTCGLQAPLADAAKPQRPEVRVAPSELELSTSVTATVVRLQRGSKVTLQARTGSEPWQNVAKGRSKRKTARLTWTPQEAGQYGVRATVKNGPKRVSSRVRKIVVRDRPSDLPISPDPSVVVSDGGPITVVNGPVRVSGPAGAIQAGQSLQVSAGAPDSFPEHDGSSLIGGPFEIRTSQGEPSKPLTVSISFSAAALQSDESAQILHGDLSSSSWVPEPTTSLNGVASAELDTLSPIDVVGNITWAVGRFTDNRSDLPTGCGSAPGWVEGIDFPFSREDALPMCAGTDSSDQVLKLHIVNNRGYSQLIQVKNADLSVSASAWGSSLEQLVAARFAALRSGSDPSEFMLAPGSSATLALSRPSDQTVGETNVSLSASPAGGNGAAQLAWALLQRLSQTVGSVTGVANCVVGYFSGLNSAPSPADSLSHLKTCVTGATDLAGRAKELAGKIATALLVVDFSYKVTDLLAADVSPARGGYSVRGINPTNPAIHVTGGQLGTIPSGTTTTHQLSASGGTAPYSFAIWSGGSNPSRVPTWAHLSSSGELVFSPPAGTDISGSFFVYATDRSGRHSPFARDRVSFSVGSGGPDAGAWSSPQPMNLNPAGDIACAGANFCASVAGGAVATGVDGTWSLPTDLGHGRSLRAISCATESFCVAVGRFGEWTAWNGSGWSPLREFSPGTDSTPFSFSDISCAEAGQCTAVGTVDGDNHAVTYSSGGWSAPQVLPRSDSGYGGLHISCISEGSCIATNFLGGTYSSSGGSWVAGPRIDSHADGYWPGITGLSCAPTGFCMAVDYLGYWWTYDNGAWSTEHEFQGASSGLSPLDVACTSSVHCVVASQGGVVDAFKGSDWVVQQIGEATYDGNIQSVACSSSNFCSALSKGTSYTAHGGVWSAPTAIGGWFSRSMSCPTSQFCAVGDEYGHVVLKQGGEWRRPSLVADDGISALSCSSSTMCMAGTTYGKVFRFDGSSWDDGTPINARPFADSYISSISCKSGSFCSAVSTNGNAFTYDGARWSSVQLALPGGSHASLIAVSCGSETSCIAVDSSGVAFTFDSHSWSAGQQIISDFHIEDLSCSSDVFCEAIGANGTDLVGIPLEDGAWGSPTVLGADVSGGAWISCPEDYWCMSIGRDGAAYSLEGGEWTGGDAAVDVGEYSEDPRTGAQFYPDEVWGISCGEVDRCTAIQEDGYAIEYER